MTRNPAWPVEITPLGPVSVGTVLWRRDAKLHVTAIVKATFSYAPGGEMAPIEPLEIQRDEAHLGNNPMRSIRAASDLSPFLESADVVFVGHAYAPRGVTSSVLPIRICVLRGNWAMLDKTLMVFGDRAPPPAGQAPPEPAPFQRLPIVYERAFGGIGSPENPLGVGFGSTPGRLMPSIVHPELGPRITAGFAPISWYFPARKRLLKGHSRKALEARIAEIPDDFDPRFFQSAPEDQRIAFLRGDEQIVLEGLHPAHPRLETRLPGVRARARIYTPDGLELPLSLNADTLAIDGDHERVSLTFRGSCPVTHEEALSGVSIIAGIELPGQPLTWPTFQEHNGFRAPMPAVAEIESPPTMNLAGTQQLDDADVIMVETEEKPTALLDLSALLAAAPAKAAAVPEANRWEATYELNDDAAASTASGSAPFALAQPGSSRSGSADPIPGAPWAPRKRQETMLLIEPDLPPAPEIEITVTDDDDDNLITGAFRPITSSSPHVPPAPPSGAGLDDDDDDGDGTTTVRISPKTAMPPLPPRTAARVPSVPSVPSAPAAVARPDHDWEGTMVLGDDPAPSAPVAPFELARPGRPSRPSAPIPGAPWAAARRSSEAPAEPLPVAPAPISSSEALETLDTPSPLLAADEAPAPPPAEPEPPPAAAPLPATAPLPVVAPPPAAPAEKAAAAQSWSWATVASSEKEVAEKTAPPRPAPAPKPAVKGTLYGKFGGKK